MVPGIGRLNVVCCQVGTWLSERRRGSTGVKVQACQLACSFPNSLSSRPLTARQSNSHVPSITRLQLQSSPSIPSPSPLKTTTAGIASGGLRAQAIARLAVRIALIAPVVIVVWAASKPTTPSAVLQFLIIHLQSMVPAAAFCPSRRAPRFQFQRPSRISSRVTDDGHMPP